MIASAAETARFLNLLYHDAPDDAWLVISWPDPEISANGKKPPMLSAWYRLRQQRIALRRIIGLSPHHNVYVAPGLRHPSCRPRRTARGPSSDVSVIPGLWVEFDHQGGVHTSTNLPGRDELLAFLEATPFRWSRIIDSANGNGGRDEAEAKAPRKSQATLLVELAAVCRALAHPRG
jgi:hypothetical protein